MNHRVLIVDDDVNLLDGLSRALSDEPYDVITATSAITVMDTLAGDSVDIVISDYDMPETNGCDLLAQVREEYPEIVRFMIAGKTTLELAYDSVNMGAVDHFLFKPCKKADLIHAIRRALNLRKE